MTLSEIRLKFSDLGKKFKKLNHYRKTHWKGPLFSDVECISLGAQPAHWLWICSMTVKKVVKQIVIRFWECLFRLVTAYHNLTFSFVREEKFVREGVEHFKIWRRLLKEASYLGVFVIICANWYHLYNLKKGEKHPWRWVTFSKVAGSSLQFF